MKKTRLISLIIIVVALISLTGCDAILEAMFPELVEQGLGGENGIGIYVEIEFPEGDTSGLKISAAVESRDTFQWVATNSIWPDWYPKEGGAVLSGYVDLFGIPDGEYRVIVWLDNINSGQVGFPDYGIEPNREAVWFSPGSTEGNNTFNFPNELQWTWIEGEAMLRIFSGEALNRDFHLGGPQVISAEELVINDPDSRMYDLFPADPGLSIKEFTWTLYGPNTANGNAFLGTGDPPQFTINYSGFSSGYYWLDVEVVYNDDWREYKGFPLRIVFDEAPAGMSYTANVYVDYAGGWPLNLEPGNTVNFEYRIVDASGGVSTFYGSTAVYDDLGRNVFDFTTGNLVYDPTFYEDGDGVDFLEIDLEIDRGGVIDRYATRYPLSVSLTDDGVGTLYILMWGSDFRPIFPLP